ncbi:MAG: ATP-binding protein [Chloroflexota bacterium]|nr:ATP-binding protein [Chloroflexota bacterium]
MYIHRIIIKDVPGIPDRDLVLQNDWLGEPLTSVLLTGPNGSGKTTLLRLIAALWASLADALIQQSSVLAEQTTLERLVKRLRRSSAFVAIEIHGLVEKPLIVSFTRFDKSDDEVAEIFNSNGFIIRLIFDSESGKQFARSPIPDSLNRLAAQVERLQLGLTDLAVEIPNVVFFDSETRQLDYEETLQRAVRTRTPSPETYYDWLATFNPRPLLLPSVLGPRSGGSYGMSLEQMLRNLKIRDSERFYETITDINAFLVGKRITDFNDRLDLNVETDQGGKHTIYDLSAGERQCLLIMFMVSRWTMPGGVVLIDGPDLHLHVSLQRQFIHELEKLVEKRNGQLIVTSHSPELWEEYSPRQRFDFGEYVAK